MKEFYLKNNKLPEKLKQKYSKIVQQIDPITKEIIVLYDSNRYVIKRFIMSSFTLKKCIRIC